MVSNLSCELFVVKLHIRFMLCYRDEDCKSHFVFLYVEKYVNMKSSGGVRIMFSCLLTYLLTCVMTFSSSGCVKMAICCVV